MGVANILARGAFLCALLSLTAAPAPLAADQVQMRNGDRYSGKILQLDTNSLVLQTDLAGKLTLRRADVTAVTLGNPAPTNAPRAGPAKPLSTHSARAAPAGTNTDLPGALRQLGAGTNFIGQIRSQMLGTAGPEANKKFDELVEGLMSGRLGLKDIRTQAAASAQQLRELKASLGADAGESLDVYLDILDSFLKETASNSAAPPLNSGVSSPGSKTSSLPPSLPRPTR